MKECNSVRVTTLVDNEVWKNGLTSTWGLSFYVEIQMEQSEHAILMDTSGSFETLTSNASKLGVNLPDAEAIFISHWHGDHCGCLSQVLPLLRQSTPVYVPSRSISGIREIERAEGVPKVCSEPTELMEGAMSTGDLGGEHSFIVRIREEGLVILTGCAHPGIINVVKRAQQASGVARVCAVIGGFHISGTREGKRVGGFLDTAGVDLVSPCHCTGADVKNAIAGVIGERYVRNGSGRIFSFG
jgi:7,8-dihydropterin-6-yl-methyl-4-(beta-D-ribofuranosyl)aminobenzene 5'-phosphate synthase